MSCSIGIGLIAWIVLLTIAGVTGIITNAPLNAVAEVGGQAMFNCTSEKDYQHWGFSRTVEELFPPEYRVIVQKCAVQPDFTNHYEVYVPELNKYKCNLIVKAATMQQAGVYTCIDYHPWNSAVLTVIDRNASITVDSPAETVEGDTVTMSYTVRYNTATATPKTLTIQPILIWTDSDGKTVTSSPSSTDNSITSSISVTAGRQDIRPYSCRIDFVINLASSSTPHHSLANNTPVIVYDPLYTSTINVLWSTGTTSGTTPDSGVADADKSKSSASGLSVGLFKRNNVIILMVGIAALLLIGSKGTSGV